MTNASMASSGADRTHGTILIRGTEVATVTRDVPVTQLRFYVDNPRIYSAVRAGEQTPEQAEIVRRLQTMEHVRELVHDIRANGGLIDPLIVRDGDYVVLEGNSRLAAYHHLRGEDAIRWGRVKCTLLPAEIDDRLIFPLLAQYHVKGRKDWAPYEKAGFVYRRFKAQAIDLSQIAKEIGLTRDEARHLVSVYQHMIDHQDTEREHWSYYDELLKSRKIRRARDEVAGFDAFIVGEIKAGRIGKAAELRDRLPTICAGNPKILKRYMEGTYTIQDAHEAAVTAGGEHPALNKLKRFRSWLVEGTTQDDLAEAPKQVRDRMQFELKEIERKARKLKDLLESKKTQAG